MTRILLILTMLWSVQSLAQNESENLKLESVQILYGAGQMHHGNQVFNHFNNAIQNPFTFPNADSMLTLGPYGKGLWYNGFNVSLEFSLRKSGSKWRYNFGSSYMNRNERSYRFVKNSETITDTVVAPVHDIASFDPQTGMSTFYTTYDTLLLDSISIQELRYNSKSQNVYLYAEIMRDFSKDKWTFSVGGGLGIGSSLRHTVTGRFTRRWESRMVRDDGFGNYYPVWYESVPNFSPTSGSVNPYGGTVVESGVFGTNVNRNFLLRPYIPVRFDAKIAQEGFFSHIAIVGSMSAGLEFQIALNEGINTRFFWNYRVGIKYIL